MEQEREISQEITKIQPEESQEEKISDKIPSVQTLINFKITDDNLGVGGAKTKYHFNVDAIRTLQQIESEKRFATPAEQVTLSKYVGWGGIPQAFDKDKSDWRKEYEELKTLLTGDEYDSARASTLNAHYTSPKVIKAIYGAVEKMGFSKGNILEPSMGIGNFFGLLPERMNESKLYGVELDGVTGRIAKQLYQDANITVSGYEKTKLPDNFFDLAIGNVPFGDYKVQDSKFDKHNFRIHDYFFAKTLDQVRPGGVVAFVTSKGTLDKANPAVRRYISQRAELLGAIRLPNNAFAENAGTEVTTDIIFLQKRAREVESVNDWVHLGKTKDGIPINSYFVEHPNMILGKMVFEKSMYGNENETACIANTDKDLASELERAISNINGQLKPYERENSIDEDTSSIPADPNVQNFSYTIVDGVPYYRYNEVMKPVEKTPKVIERIIGLVELRDCEKTLIKYQLEDESNERIKEQQDNLNKSYDLFTSKYGIINGKLNERAFDGDSSYYMLCSLENIDVNKNVEKADIFTKRTIKQRRSVQSVENATEALAISIAEKACVDVNFMSVLAKKSPDEIIEELRGVIYKNPVNSNENNPYEGYETADEYLSGNIRKKLEIATNAAQHSREYELNIEALQESMPKPLSAAEIDVRLGATWIDPKYIQDFMVEVMDTPRYLIRPKSINVSYFKHSAEWEVSGKREDSTNLKSNVTFGTPYANGYKILEESLNLRDIRVFDTELNEEGKPVTVLNKKETTLAQQKQQALKQAFKDWIFKDQERRDELVQKYNKLFNSTKPREYDGSHIEFTGINPNIALKQHQVNAIARIMYGGNTLLAHTVGAGKTFEMIAAAMESKRLGLCQKSMFVVPNHLTEQTATEFMKLYPSANLLVATKDTFQPKERKKFCSRIATGDYDAIIIGHSQFEKIPVSKERQERLLKEQINEVAQGLKELEKEKGSNFSVKQLEKSKKNLEIRLANLNKTTRKDDVITFEELGVDRVFIDEAHYYKNLYLVTKMRNVAGIPQTEAQKSSDLFMKCQYMDEITGGKGIIFATGTPVSNSMTELYTMMRYLQHDKLKERDLGAFDSWASTFGETVTAIELAPEGTGYRARTRFAKFYNLPELMKMFKDCADIQTADMLNLPVPKANFHVEVAEPSDYQMEMVEELSKRAEKIHNRMVEPNQDNMLKVTTDGRKIGLDQRLMNPLLADHEGSKLNMCVRNVYDIWEQSQKDRLTQLVFCDFSTPNSDGRFNVYDDIKEKLIEKGIPKHEIAFIHDANTDEQKDELFEKVRAGQVRVLMGSTQKMGAGTNVQNRLFASHHLDCPWRPSDLEQRDGRIIRQKNMNEEVHIYKYVTKSTFDAYLYQTIENKQKFISQVMTSKNPVRSCEDADESVLSYAEVKALCAGDNRIREKMDLDVNVAKLKLLKSEHQNTIYKLEDNIKKILPQKINEAINKIAHYEADTKQVFATNTEEFPPMTIKGKVFSGKEGKISAGEALISACGDTQNLSRGNAEIGEYRGFKMSLSYSRIDNEFDISLQREGTYKTTLGTSAIGNLTRIDNLLDRLEETIESEKLKLASLHKQLEDAKIEVKKEFQFEDELKVNQEKLDKLNIELNLDKPKNENIEGVNIEVVDETKANEGNIGNLNRNENLEENIKEEKNKIIKESKDILGRGSFVVRPLNACPYEGAIISSSEHYVVQKIAEKHGILHEVEKIQWLNSEEIGGEKNIIYDEQGRGVEKSSCDEEIEQENDIEL